MSEYYLEGLSSLGSGQSGVNCNNCGRFTEFRVCMSDKNGNKGRLVALVRHFSIIGLSNLICFSVTVLTTMEENAVSSGGSLGLGRLVNLPASHRTFLLFPPFRIHFLRPRTVLLTDVDSHD